MNSDEVKFSGKVVRNMYSNNDYKIYALMVDTSKYNNVKLNSYGNVSIVGEMQDLEPNIEYTIVATEENSKYGISYKVKNVSMNRPSTLEETYSFLCEILTYNQAKTLFEHYPDIVDMVIEHKTDEIDFKLLKGIGEKTFNKIKNKIIQNYAFMEIIAEFKGLVTISVVRKLYNKYSSTELIRKKLMKEPYYCLTSLSGISFKTADTMLLDFDREGIIDFGYDLKSSKQRCLACVHHVLLENQNDGNTKMGLIELKHQVEALVPKASEHFVDCLKDKSIYFDKNTCSVSKSNTFYDEAYITYMLMDALKVENKWDASQLDMNQYKKLDDFDLSDEQYSLLEKVINNNVVILNGSAGTGKSSSTLALIKMINDLHKSKLLIAPSGRAAKVLASYTGEKASTIHRGLAYMPPNQWRFNLKNKLSYDIVVIDEFSMCDLFIFKKVIDAIDFTKTKLLLIGDNAQLPSIQCGNILHDLMRSNKIPTITLSKVFRYSDGGLMKVATDVRMGKKYIDSLDSKVTVLGDNKDYAFIQSNNTLKDLLGLYSKLLKSYNPEDIEVLSCYNKGDLGTININNYLQKIANPNGVSCLKTNRFRFLEGDIVIQTANNYNATPFIEHNIDYIVNTEFDDNDKDETFIANGELGIITKVDEYNEIVYIDFDGTKVIYNKDDMMNVSLGYSISIHKSQGSSSKVIILITPSEHTFMLNSNIIYVGLTRMKERCYHIGNIETVNKSIKKKVNYNRDTWMQSLLVDC